MAKQKLTFDLRSPKTDRAARPPKDSPHTRIDAGKDGTKLPRRLTWNANLHPGAETVEIVFEAEPGGYVLELDVLEHHLRRVRDGSNLDWDGVSQRMAGSAMRH